MHVSLASALPLATAGVIVIASLNTSHSKRSQDSKYRRSNGNLGTLPITGSGGSGGSGSGANSVNYNRAMVFPSPEFQPSLSSARTSPPRQLSYTLSRNNARHARTHSLNRNVPHTPSATVSMPEVIHSRNPFPGSPAAKAASATGSTRRCMIHHQLNPCCRTYHRADANKVPVFSRPLSIPISFRGKSLRQRAPENRCPQTSRPEPLPGQAHGRAGPYVGEKRSENTSTYFGPKLKFQPKKI